MCGRLQSPLKQVQHLSLYVLSSDNMCRQDGSQELGFDLPRRIYRTRPSEFDARFDKQTDVLDKILKLTSFTPVGELHLLPQDIQAILKEFQSRCWPPLHAHNSDRIRRCQGCSWSVRRSAATISIWFSWRPRTAAVYFSETDYVLGIAFSDKLWPAITAHTTSKML